MLLCLFFFVTEYKGLQGISMIYLPFENIVPFAAPNVEQATKNGMIQAITPRTRLPQVWEIQSVCTK